MPIEQKGAMCPPRGNFPPKKGWFNWHPLYNVITAVVAVIVSTVNIISRFFRSLILSPHVGSVKRNTSCLTTLYHIFWQGYLRSKPHPLTPKRSHRLWLLLQALEQLWLSKEKTATNWCRCKTQVQREDTEWDIQESQHGCGDGGKGLSSEARVNETDKSGDQEELVFFLNFCWPS